VRILNKRFARAGPACEALAVAAMSIVPLKVCATELFLRELRTRIPFRYGITTMTEVPHLFLRLQLEIGGKLHTGVAADHLPPKWFTKNPDTSFAEDREEMLEVIRHACRAAENLPSSGSVFDLWQGVLECQKHWATERGIPPLLSGFGVSLVERACIDAFCRATQTPFAQAVRANSLGIRLGDIHPELEPLGLEPGRLLPSEPLRSLRVRHTVGLSDPLTDSEITEHVDDGLPHSLEASIRRYGLTHFKIKLGGDACRDRARLHAIAGILGREGKPCAFTLDGNENYRAVAPFRALWEELRADPLVARFLENLLFVEQPLQRDVALEENTARELLAWEARPALIIDESDSELTSLPRALGAGYIGTSHKNCKGVFKGIANACLLEHRRRVSPEQPLTLSAEDLSNIGPVALLQDLAVVATLGIPHVERNGHHYFAGLQQFPKATRDGILSRHGDLYERHPEGFPAVRVEAGCLRVGSLVEAPFGTACEFLSEGLVALKPS
jgi:hypothetical protein